MNYLREVLREQQSDRDRDYLRQRQISMAAWLTAAAVIIAVGWLMWTGQP